MNPILYLPIAPPAAGKSYTAAKMVENGVLLPDAIVEPDHYRSVMTGDRASQTANGKVFQIVDMIVEERLRCGQDVYLDATNLNTKFRDKMIERVKTASDVSIIALVSLASKELLDERNADRAHPVPQHVLDRMYKEYHLPSLNFPHGRFTLAQAQKWTERPI